MLIYTPVITSRVQYIFDFILRETMGIDYEMTSNEDFFKLSDNRLKWSYGTYFESIPTLPSANLLFEKDIAYKELRIHKHEDLVTLFDVEKIGGVDFDIFASAFYLISRYEEYLPSVIDQHGRYAAIQSIAVEFGFLETAMVNRYVLWFVHWLKNQFPYLNIKLEKPKALVSLDIDHPFYSKDVSLDRWLIRTIKNRRFFQEKDKYDTYDYILDTLGDIPSIFFFLCPKTPSDMDHHNRRESQNFKQLIYHIRTQSKIGIHPSYYAEEKELLTEEIEWLSRLHERQIKSSRFHYLKFDIEKSYDKLSQSGIQNDFSMGYGTHTGFRTSTSYPFYFFDLKKNKKTNLRIYTPCIMDSLFKYGHQENFKEKVAQLIAEVKTYGGLFIPIFHNDILADENWKDNFNECIEKIKTELN